MKLQQSDDPQTIDRIPTGTLLEGLARVYDLVLVTDFEGSVLWMSNGLVALCDGASFQVGRDAQTILPEMPRLPHPEQVFTLRSKLRSNGFLSNVRVDLATKSNESMPVEVNMMPVSTELDDRPFYVVIARPVSEDAQKPAPNLASVFDDAPDAMLAIDANGFVVCANAAIEELIGHSPNELVDTPVAALLSDVNELEKLVSSLGVGGEVGDWDLTLMHKDGEDVHVAASARRRRSHGDGGGAFSGTVLCLRNITERQRVAADLEHKNAELEHCVQALAHDLRSPLVALLGFSRLLRQDYGTQLDDTGLHFIDRIEQAGRTMEDLIHDLLELSRIGQPGERKSLVDPKTVLSQLHAELKPRLDEGQIRLDLPIDPPLIYCDRMRLYQVFSNLIGNAIDHMGACDEAFIEVSVIDEVDHHHITVSDAGRGVPDENHQQIFDVFHSLGPAQDGRRGTGIGLAIVKKISETHGGHAWLENRAGGGATFHVTFAHR